MLMDSPAAALFAMGALYFTYQYMRGSGSTTAGSGASPSRDEAMAAARLRQQAMLASSKGAAATSSPKKSTAAPASPAAVPQGETAQTAMPSRMQKALEKQDAAAAAAERRLSGAQGSCDKGACDAKDCCEKPAPPASSQGASASRTKKESMTERLARIERGKGPSDHNPLHGQSSASSYRPASKKKGG
jgi:hypothetical protein